jgi:dTDP-4-dehydrorhamnose 3,5-epimerase
VRVSPLGIPGLLLIEPDVHRDGRGFFLETYHERKYREAGIPAAFVQDNRSSSTRGILRGMHGQLRRPQGKLVACLGGEIHDVAVDARPGSAHFGKWVGVRLTGDGFRQFYIPPGFLHGFCVLSERAEVAYKCTTLYDPDDEIGVVWNDPDLAIEWPCEAPVLSERDKSYPRFAEVRDRLEAYRGL